MDYSASMRRSSMAFSVLITAITTLGISTQRAAADAIVVSRAMEASTIAEIFIEDDSLRMELEIGIGDLAAFRNLLPDDIYSKMGYDPEPLSARIRRFFAGDLTIRPGRSDPLSGRITTIEPRARIIRDSVTGEPLPSQEDAGEGVVWVSI